MAALREAQDCGSDGGELSAERWNAENLLPWLWRGLILPAVSGFSGNQSVVVSPAVRRALMQTRRRLTPGQKGAKRRLILDTIRCPRLDTRSCLALDASVY